jgi:hypothetical protein
MPRSIPPRDLDKANYTRFSKGGTRFRRDHHFRQGRDRPELKSYGLICYLNPHTRTRPTVRCREGELGHESIRRGEPFVTRKITRGGRSDQGGAAGQALSREPRRRPRLGACRRIRGSYVLIVIVADRRLLFVGLIGDALLIAIWVWSRTVGLPIGPEPGVPPSNLAPRTARRRRSRRSSSLRRCCCSPAAAGGAKRSRRVAIRSAAVVWVMVILLTTGAIVEGGGTAHADVGATRHEHWRGP